MNAFQLMEAISARSEESVRKDLFDDDAPDAQPIPDAAANAANRSQEPPRILRLIAFAAAAAACVMLVGGFVWLMHRLSQKPESVPPGTAVSAESAADETKPPESIPEETALTSTAGNSQNVSPSGSYAVLCPSVPAGEALNCTEITLPDAEQLSVWGLMDEHTLLIEKDSGELGICTVSETGAAAYRQLCKLGQSDAPAAYSTDFIALWDDERHICRVLNCKTGRLGGVLYQMPQSSEFGSAVILENVLYIEEYEMQDYAADPWTADIHCIDLTTGTELTVMNGYHTPHIMNGQLYAFNAALGIHSSAMPVRFTEPYEAAEADDLSTLMTDGAEYARVLRGPDGWYADRRTDSGYSGLMDHTLVNLTTGQQIVSAHDGISDLKIGEHFLVWSNYGANFDVSPAVYDIDGQQVLTLEPTNPLPKDVIFWGHTSGKTAVIVTADSGYKNRRAFFLHKN